jgi:glycosyltransferase involved in cell wall biosynthesis
MPKFPGGESIFMDIWKLIRGAGRPVARIAVNARAVSGAWGGGNQWLAQFARMAAYQGFEVVDRLQEGVDAAVILHTANQPEATFQLEELREFKKKFPRLAVLQRVNENDARKNTSHVDQAIEAWNELADYTVFVSAWLRDYHAQRWFDVSRAHEAVINGADSRFFHPVKAKIWRGGNDPFVIVTHHWSDNWSKGFDLYQELDLLLASGALPGVELKVIGRWPKEIKWKRAFTEPAASGADLAKLLKECHVYITGTKAEPGAMHYIEGLQCGLPLLYRSGGGGVEEIGQKVGGLLINGSLASAIMQMKETYPERRKAVLQNLPSGEIMAMRYLEIIRSMICF